MKFVEKAFNELWPDEELRHDITVKYSGRFSDYNANVTYTPWKMNLRLRKTWRGVDEDIRIGLVQR